MLSKKRKNAQILLKSQESALECWKVKIVLQIRNSSQRNRDILFCGVARLSIYNVSFWFDHVYTRETW